MADINFLKSIGTVKQFAENTFVFMQDEHGDCMYLVLKGRFGVYIDSYSDFPYRLASIESGTVFGEMSLIDGSPRSATIIAETDGTALIINKTNFAEFLEKAPDLSANIIKTLEARAITTAETLRGLGLEPPLAPPAPKQTDALLSPMTHMAALSSYIRKMNALLPPVSTEEESATPLLPPADDTVRLLPIDYRSLDNGVSNDNRTKINRRDFICPYCGVETTGFIPLFSVLTQKSTSLDGRIIYEDFDILRYTNIVCANCNYTDSYQIFGKPRKCPPGKLISGNMFKNIENFTGYKMFYAHSADEAILSHLQNIYCMERTTNDPLRFGKAWMRLYWLYRDHNVMNHAVSAAAAARHYYKRYLDSYANNLTPKSKMYMLAKLGELSIAVGDYDKAQYYYTEILPMNKKTDPPYHKLCTKRYNEIFKTPVKRGK